MTIIVETIVNAEIEAVWLAWTTPEDIKHWNAASDDWHTTSAEVNLQPGGKFTSRMEARDGSFGFDFSGVYRTVIPHRLIEYTLDDERKVRIEFSTTDSKTKIVESFEPESQNSIELQKFGWQAILTNFKSYVEAHK